MSYADRASEEHDEGPHSTRQKVVISDEATTGLVVDLRDHHQRFEGELNGIRWRTRTAARAAKRGLDIVLVLVVAIPAVPFLLLACLAITLESRGSPMFRQQRCGLNGRSFQLWKLRTMVKGAEHQLNHMSQLASDGSLHLVDAPAFKSAEDPRVTRVGRFLRRTSMDELPQLINVLLGQMSIVGPRPLVWAEVEVLSDRDRVLRHAMPPGVTCTWQTSDRDSVSWANRITMDTTYVAEWSFWMDIRLVAKTVPAVVLGRGSY